MQVILFFFFLILPLQTFAEDKALEKVNEAIKMLQGKPTENDFNRALNALYYYGQPSDEVVKALIPFANSTVAETRIAFEVNNAGKIYTLKSARMILRDVLAKEGVNNVSISEEASNLLQATLTKPRRAFPEIAAENAAILFTLGHLLEGKNLKLKPDSIGFITQELKLETGKEISADSIVKAMSAADGEPANQSIEFLRTVLDAKKVSIASKKSAIERLGNMHNEASADALLELLRKSDFPQEQGAVIGALFYKIKSGAVTDSKLNVLRALISRLEEKHEKIEPPLEILSSLNDLINSSLDPKLGHALKEMADQIIVRALIIAKNAGLHQNEDSMIRDLMNTANATALEFKKHFKFSDEHFEKLKQKAGLNQPDGNDLPLRNSGTPTGTVKTHGSKPN